MTSLNVWLKARLHNAECETEVRIFEYMRLHIQLGKIIHYTAPLTYLNISGKRWSGYSSKLGLLSSITDLLKNKWVWLKNQNVEQNMRLHADCKSEDIGI